MAKLNFRKNPDDDAREGFPIVPAGEYTAAITASEIKVTKGGDEALNFEWTILDGQFKNSKIFELLNLYNQNQQAVLIATKAMNAICDICGFPNGVDDSNELHNKPMLIKTGIQASSQYGDRSVIKSRRAHDGTAPVSKKSPASAGGGMKKAPWDKSGSDE